MNPTSRSKKEPKWYVNINQHVLRANTSANGNAPPIRVSKGKSGKGAYFHSVSLPAGSRLVYDPLKPILKCGARLVIECPEEPKGILIHGT
jgi:hypothetical protein